MKKLIIAGDFFEFSTISKFPKVIRETALEEVFATAEEIVEVLLNQFDEIVMIVGNHDLRIAKLLEGELPFNRLVRMITDEVGKKIKVSVYPYCTLNDTWRITHPRNFSGITTRVAYRLASKYHKSILSSHGHHFGFTFDASGQYVVGDTGGMFDIGKLSWVMLSDSTYDVQKNGFWLIVNNYALPFATGFTDWDWWEKHLKY